MEKPSFSRRLTGTGGTVQIEDRFRPWTDDVYVCWPVVVRVDDYPKVANSQDGRHKRIIAYS
jgi:hypothetical protein